MLNLTAVLAILNNAAPGEVLVSPAGEDVTIMAVLEGGLHLDLLTIWEDEDGKHYNEWRDETIRLASAGYVPA